MARSRDAIEAAALGWVIRTRDARFDDWESFTLWLEESPAHARAYDSLMLAEEQAISPLLTAPAGPPASPHARPASRLTFVTDRRRWIGGAIAASLVAALGYGVVSTRPAPYEVATAPGERRSVALADGSRIDLNGGTRLTLDRNDPRTAELAGGEALFTVVHDDDRPFVVRTGGAVLHDVGTVFNVVREAGVTEVAVSEGAVIYNPDGEAIRLDPGRMLSVADRDSSIALGTRDRRDVDSWRQGRLSYSSAPIGRVAADLARNLGVPIMADPAIAARPFSGVIRLDGDRAHLFARLGPLLDVTVARDGAGLRLSPRNHADRAAP